MYGVKAVPSECIPYTHRDNSFLTVAVMMYVPQDYGLAGRLSTLARGSCISSTRPAANVSCRFVLAIQLVKRLSKLYIAMSRGIKSG